MDNNNDQKIIVGLWITAIGTIFFQRLQPPSVLI